MGTKLLSIFAISIFSLISLISMTAQAEPQKQVTVSGNQLVIDGVQQPQLFGAEVQYFRLRGGYGPNVPREKVIALWNRALDKVVEAGMNAVSFYIPWDFHEYAEGKFDFTGTADEDGDGKPDYPSRDVVTFIRLIQEHGIKHILVRPGPYINAEWGFLGFGAIPEWFHDRYPDSHMQDAFGNKTKLYDFNNPELLAKTNLWFTALYNQVLKNNMGAGKPIDFLQIDNETNYLWQSIYNHDYSPSAVASYQRFLRTRYSADLTVLNLTHHRQWKSWEEILPPKKYGENLGEDQDWYRFHDETIHAYLGKIRRLWEDLGVREPQLIFTLAESYNAASQGLLPNYVFRNDRGKTGLMTVNLYPKTFELPSHPLLNNPFKADLDVKAAIAANAAYWGSKQEWAMGPEIQGGWWRGIDVSPEARRQTYLTVIGHGLKAFFVYYFNEGNNYGARWGYDRAVDLYSGLRRDDQIPDSCPISELSNAFWGELQSRMDRQYTLGFDSRALVQADPGQLETLYFDAPLDGEANPRGHYYDLKTLGTQVIAPHQRFLARSVEVEDEVGLVKDTENHVPNGNGIDNVLASADWNAGLLGYLLNANINPHLLIGEISEEAEFAQKLLVHIDPGINAERTIRLLDQAVESGHSVVNFLGDQLAKSLGYVTGEPLDAMAGTSARQSVVFHSGTRTLRMEALASPLFQYDSKKVNEAGCESILFSSNGAVLGYRCKRPGGGVFTQIGAVLFDDYNSSAYGNILDATKRKVFMEALLRTAGVSPKISLSSDSDETVAFARTDPEKRPLWITVKSGAPKSQLLKLRVNPMLLPSSDGVYEVRSLLGEQPAQRLSAADLARHGFSVMLQSHGSDVYVIKPVLRR